MDLRPVFSDISTNTQLYYKTDTHWNCLGGYYASNEILTKISISQPQIQLHALSDYNFFLRDFKSDMSTMMSWGVREDQMEVIPKFNTGLSIAESESKNPKIKSLRITVNDNKDLPKLMVFHDSFYGCLGVFIEPNFSRVTSVHFKDAELTDYLNMISSEKPDVVIVEFVERYIGFFYDNLKK